MEARGKAGGGSLGGHGASLGISKASMTAQEGHQGRQDDSQTAQDGSKTAQDGPMTAQICLKIAQGGPQDGSRGLQEDPPEGPKKPNVGF